MPRNVHAALFSGECSIFGGVAGQFEENLAERGRRVRIQFERLALDDQMLASLAAIGREGRLQQPLEIGASPLVRRQQLMRAGHCLQTGLKSTRELGQRMG